MGICASNVDGPPQQATTSKQPATSSAASSGPQPQQNAPLPASIPRHSDAQWEQREKMRQAAEARLSVQKKKTTAGKRFSTNTTLTPTVTSHLSHDDHADGRTVEMTDMAAPAATKGPAGAEDDSKYGTRSSSPRHRRAGSLEQEHPEYFGASTVSTRD